MPDGIAEGLFIITIEKMYLGEYWTNRYIVQGPDLAAANGRAPALVAAERAITLNTVLFTRSRTSDTAEGTDIYQVNNLNVFGSLGITSTPLPLFNVARIDFSTAGGGRPSRKYMRGVLREQDIDFNTISGEFVNNINTNYAQPVLAVVGYVDVDGQQFSSASVYPFVGMRQLRRGSKRKAVLGGTPV